LVSSDAEKKFTNQASQNDAGSNALAFAIPCECVESIEKLSRSTLLNSHEAEVSTIERGSAKKTLLPSRILGNCDRVLPDRHRSAERLEVDSSDQQDMAAFPLGHFPSPSKTPLHKNSMRLVSKP
jgi:hypothetical protein